MGFAVVETVVLETPAVFDFAGEANVALPMVGEAEDVAAELAEPALLPVERTTVDVAKRSWLLLDSTGGDVTEALGLELVDWAAAALPTGPFEEEFVVFEVVTTAASLSP